MPASVDRWVAGCFLGRSVTSGGARCGPRDRLARRRPPRDAGAPPPDPERAAALIGVDDAFLYFLKPDEQTLGIVAGIGGFAAQIGFSVGVGGGLAGRVAEAGEPLTAADLSSYAGGSNELGPMKVRTFVGAPLRGTEGIVGVIGLASRDASGFDEEEIALLDRFGRVAAIRPSASFGVAAFPLHGSTAAEVMKVADEALYRAKQRGGDDIFAFAGWPVTVARRSLAGLHNR